MIFILSKRFLIPFFVVWILHLCYLLAHTLYLWHDDFKGKGIPASFIIKWLGVQLAPLLIVTFTISFFIAIIFYTHYHVRKKKLISSMFFSKWNLLVVAIFAVSAFLFSSFLEPRSIDKSSGMLAQIVFAKPGEPFNEHSTEFTPGSTGSRKRPPSMTFTELFKERDSLRLANESEEGPNSRIFKNDNGYLRKVEFLINKKIALPFIIILSYFLGILIGASFYRIHVTVPLFIGYFVGLAGWHYVQKAFETMSKREQISYFIGANGATILFGVLAILWFFLLKKYGFPGNRILPVEQDGTSTIDTH